MQTHNVQDVAKVSQARHRARSALRSRTRQRAREGSLAAHSSGGASLARDVSRPSGGGNASEDSDQYVSNLMEMTYGIIHDMKIHPSEGIFLRPIAISIKLGDIVISVASGSYGSAFGFGGTSLPFASSRVTGEYHDRIHEPQRCCNDFLGSVVLATRQSERGRSRQPRDM